MTITLPQNLKSRHKVALSALVCILLQVALTSCSRNLTRTEAQRQLEAATKGQFFYITGGLSAESFGRIPSGQLRGYEPDVAALSDAGLLKVTVIASGVREPLNFEMQLVDHIVITPTEKAKPFLAGTFPAGSSECSDGCIKLRAATPTIEVQGITEPAQGFGQTMSTVAFQVSWKNTEVGNILNKRYTVDKEEANFVKYDDGWRLKK